MADREELEPVAPQGAPSDAADVTSAAPAPSVSHLADEAEESLMRAAGYAAEKEIPLRLRIALFLWTGRQYDSWKNQIWKVDTSGAEESRAIKEALELFFDALSICGSGKLVGEMQEVLLRVKGIRGVVDPMPTTR